MPKILVSLADRETQENIAADLRLRKYSITAMDPVTADANPKAVAEEMIASKAVVAILDYLEDDAASVKMLQAVTEQGVAPRFIFILPEGTPVSHILMAVNEGAAAILEKPVNLEALANYVDRAINGPARFRHDAGKDAAQSDEYHALEKESQSMRVQLAANRKLIAYLMSTPVANQHRTAMVVSDSAYQRDHLRKLLEDHGFYVSLAKNPDDGIETALAENPRVVISDLEMEGKNGVEFCRDLKIDHKFMPCHFVICTANSEKIEEVMAPGNGVDACVIKPSNESGNQELIATAAMGLLL